MTIWLLIMANSATSIMCTLAGAFILVGIGLPVIKRNVKYVGIYVLAALFVFIIMQLSLTITEFFISNLGRDTTLTGRTDLWAELVGMAQNPLIGTGYDSFWLGDRMEKIWGQFMWKPTQSHNGYLEIFLELGLIGLFLLSCIIISAFKSIRVKNKSLILGSNASNSQ